MIPTCAKPGLRLARDNRLPTLLRRSHPPVTPHLVSSCVSMFSNTRTLGTVELQLYCGELNECDISKAREKELPLLGQFDPAMSFSDTAGISIQDQHKALCAQFLDAVREQVPNVFNKTRSGNTTEMTQHLANYAYVTKFKINYSCVGYINRREDCPSVSTVVSTRRGLCYNANTSSTQS